MDADAAMHETKFSGRKGEGSARYIILSVSACMRIRGVRVRADVYSIHTRRTAEVRRGTRDSVS